MSAARATGGGAGGRRRTGLARAAAACALAATALLAAVPARAFVCTTSSDDGPNLAWASRAITLARSGVGDEIEDPAAIDAALANAAAAWTGVGCSDLEVSVGAPTFDRLAGFDWASGAGSSANENIVVFRNGVASDPLDAWVHQLGALAITTVTFESNAGRLLDADVEVNDVVFTFSACDACQVEFDLENTLTHELGHVVGLDHSAQQVATMFASAPRGDTSKRTLDLDDEEAVCTVYPAGGPTGLCPGAGARELPPDVRFSEAGCGAAPSGSQGAAGAWMVVPLLISLRGRARRARSAAAASADRRSSVRTR